MPNSCLVFSHTLQPDTQLHQEWRHQGSLPPPSSSSYWYCFSSSFPSYFYLLLLLLLLILHYGQNKESTLGVCLKIFSTDFNISQWDKVIVAFKKYHTMVSWWTSTWTELQNINFNFNLFRGRWARTITVQGYFFADFGHSWSEKKSATTKNNPAQ